MAFKCIALFVYCPRLFYYEHVEGVFLHIANTSAGSLIAIDVLADGSAGPARVIVSDPSLVGADGIEIDHAGNTYIAVNIQDRISVVSAKGKLSTVIEGDSLALPTALVFGRGRDSRGLFICNNGNVFFSGSPQGSGLLRLDLEDCHHRGHGNFRK